MATINPVCPLSDPDYRRIQAFLQKEAGITLGPAKKPLVVGRLGKRLRVRDCGDYDTYLRLLDTDAAERQQAVDLLTTNETYFFREAKHFAFLGEQIIPQRAKQVDLRIWSAACSSGEEPYSIAMVLAERRGRGWEILASDLSTRVLASAARGIYPLERAEKIPKAYLKHYCLRGVGPQEGSFSIVPDLRKAIHFSQINLNNTLPSVGDFDVIFLRNVLIYFDPPAKKTICSRLLARLRPGGYFIVGHSESLNGIAGGLRLVQPAVYQKD
ncbi:CheR family methyltransferase [Acidithiobacillus ferrianus]|uniref:CheR family methyltransferase n=1 Tax=Acidithiobacillus ferrianus TaxID=2678518 RepID=UPI0034E44E04